MHYTFPFSIQLNIPAAKRGLSSVPSDFLVTHPDVVLTVHVSAGNLKNTSMYNLKVSIASTWSDCLSICT